MNNKIKEILIVVFGGPFGLHKFINREIGMGILYLLTGGLFFIGWINDIIKVLTNNLSINIKKSLMSDVAIQTINNGKIPNLQGTNLNLASDEICCYMDRAYTYEDKTVTTGYTRNHNGVSFRIAKGISYHAGESDAKAIRETQRTTYSGILYLTNKRVIYTSQNKSFDKNIEKITAIHETKEGLLIQIGSTTYSILLKTNSEFMKVFNLLKQVEKLS